MKKTLSFILLLFLALFIIGCGASGNGSAEAPDMGYESGDMIPGASEDADDNGPDGFEGFEAGQLTASAFNDCENYPYWLNLITSNPNGNFQDHYLAAQYESFMKTTNLIDTKNMIAIKVTDGELPIANTKVTVLAGSIPLFNSYTNSFGIMFAHVPSTISTGLTAIVSYNSTEYSFEIPEIPENRQVTLEIDEKQSSLNLPKVLDLAFVVDVTGSMGDELRYLKAELRDVILEVQKLDIQVRLALIFYRDTTDAFVTRTYNFTDDIDSQIANLGSQSANGGGDTPEAVEVAFEEANKLNWGDNTTKLLIHVSDAPPHSTTQQLTSFAQNVVSFANKGIRFIPVMCSGSDYLTEMLLRTAAVYTGGTFTYITDDSGIGNDHSEPETPNTTVVEYLNKMLIRLITIYCTGVNIEPVPYNAPAQHTITFDSCGGSQVNAQIVKNGETLTEIVPPVYEGYRFVGWFTANHILMSDYSNPFDFNSTISSSFVLYAVWEEIKSEYVVTFDSKGGTPINSQIVAIGGCVSRPVDPVKEGATFLGWFTADQIASLDLSTPFNFDEPITGDLTLYAVWI